MKCSSLSNFGSRFWLLAALLVLGCSSASAQDSASEATFRDPSKPVEERSRDLVSRLTLDEKIAQLIYDAPAIERLGIPAYNWWNEALHGVGRGGRATVFPQAIGLAATFDTDLIYQVATAISDEARAKHHAAARAGNRGRYRGLTFWTPNINIFRDPRWGRGQETYGEDPFLTSKIGVAFVRGLQGEHPTYLKAAACAKHYVVHSGPEGARHHFDARVSRKDLYETYLPAFRALVEAGVEAVMGAYNRTNGEPCTASKWLLQDILRGEFGFKGHIVSDCWALVDLHENHKVTASPSESAALAINAGTNLNCGSTFPHLKEAVAQGLVDEKTIDSALVNLLQTRFRLGLFDPPDRVPYTAIPPSVINSDDHKQLAREAASKSIVLLKNRPGVLPLRSDTQFIYVVGPNAASTEVLRGNYYGVASEMVTILDGIARQVSDSTTLQYAHGCLLDRPNPNPIDWTTSIAAEADVTIAVMGLSRLLEGEEGEAIASPQKGDRESIGLPPNQIEYLRKLRRQAGDKPLIVILTGGSPLAIPEVHELADAVLYAWYPGEQGGNAVADVLFGRISPSGRLPVTVPRSTEQLPPFEDYSMVGRTYRFMTDSPLYPFGFGLSYSTFEYSEISATAGRMAGKEPIEVVATVTNSGSRTAEEVVQLYITDLEASTRVPLYSLKGFQRVRLQPGESRKVVFEAAPEMFRIIDDEGRSILEPGDFKIWIGGSSPGPRSRELGGAGVVSTVVTVHEGRGA